MKKLSVFILAVTLIVGMIAPLGVNSAGLCGDLPATVTVYLAEPWTTAYFETTISGDGFLNGTYDGWCIDIQRNAILETNFDANVVCSYDPAADSYVAIPGNFDLVNWVLNQGFRGQTAPVGTYHWQDVQMAIWRLLEDPDYDAWGATRWTEENVESIVALAQANGEGFVPGVGDLVAVILVPINQTDRIGQISIIGMTRTGGDEGCTPGYWKNNWDKWEGVSWGPTGYDGDELFSDVFDRTITVMVGRQPIADPTLFQALEAQGGGINALARHAVAALLNAASPDVDYAMGEAGVITAVQAAVDGGDEDISALAGDLADYNEAGCPINQHGEAT